MITRAFCFVVLCIASNGVVIGQSIEITGHDVEQSVNGAETDIYCNDGDTLTVAGFLDVTNNAGEAVKCKVKYRIVPDGETPHPWVYQLNDAGTGHKLYDIPEGETSPAVAVLESATVPDPATQDFIKFEFMLEFYEVGVGGEEIGVQLGEDTIGFDFWWCGAPTTEPGGEENGEGL